MVMGGGCEFKSWRGKLDGQFSHYPVVKLSDLIEKTKNKRKEAGIDQFFDLVL